MVRLSATPADGVVDAAASRNVDAGPTLTVTDRPVPFVSVPSVTVMLLVSALYRVMTPLFDPETDATPFVTVIAVAVPRLTAVPELLVTVGVCEPLTLAPAIVRLLLPVYVVAVLPSESRAVTVRLSAAPAVGV